MLEYKAYDYSGGKPVQVDICRTWAPVLRVCVPPFTRPSPKRATSCSRNISPAKNSRRKRLSSVFPRVLKSGTISPVFCGDAMLMRGMEQFMDGLCWLAPSAADKGRGNRRRRRRQPVEISVKEDAATAAIVFKTVADPFIGKLSYVKVLSGKISTETPLINMRTGNTERVGKNRYDARQKAGRCKKPSLRAISAPSRSLPASTRAIRSAHPHARSHWTASHIPPGDAYGHRPEE